MQKKILLVVGALVFVVSAFINKPKHDLVGHWVIKSGQDGKIMVDFKNDGTFKTVIPAENFVVVGKYKMKDDVISIMDSTCGNSYWGTYKLNFLSEDSVYTTVVMDSCTGRRSASDKATFVRQK